MIKVMIGFHKKPGADVQPTLQKLKAFAMTFEGFAGTENLESEDGGSIFVLLFNWQTQNDCQAWKESHLLQQILKEAGVLLIDQPKVTTYKVLPASGWPSIGSIP